MITLKNVTKIYHSIGEDVIALNDINLKFNKNQLTFIVGDSGSGKSTLLNVIGGLDSIDSGLIMINGENHKGKNSRRIGFIFQDFCLIENLTVKENLYLAMSSKDDDKVESALCLVGLEGFSNKKVYDLSGGERQRIAIARTIIMDQDILLCDEPTGSLDEENTKLVFDIFKKISKEKTIIIVSHNIKISKEYADRIIELEDGEIINDNILKSNESNLNEITKNNSKPKLNCKLFFKLSFSYFFSRPVLSITYLVLCFIFSLMVGLTYNTINIDYNDLIYDGMSENNIDYLSLVKTAKDVDNGSLGEEEIYSSDKEMSLLNEDNIFYNIYSFDKYDDTKITNYASENFSYMMSSSLNGYVEINQKLIDDFGFSLIGNLPKNNNEIVITDYTYYSISKLGIVVNENVFIPTDENNILGKKIQINNQEYIVCGVLDTNFNFDRYLSLYTDRHTYIDQELEISKMYGFHNVIFVNEGFHKHQTYSEDNGIKCYDLRPFKMGSLLPMYSKNENVYYTEKLIWDLPDYDKVYFKPGYTKNSLDENEIIISLRPTLTNMKKEDLVYQGIEIYALENYELVKEEFDALFPDFSGINGYIEYLDLNVNEDVEFSECTEEDYFYLGVQDCILNCKPGFTIEYVDAYFNCKNDSNDISTFVDCEIVGLCYDYDQYQDNYDVNYVYCSEEFAEDLVYNCYYDYFNDIVYSVCHKKTFMEYFDMEYDDHDFILNNSYTYDINFFNKDLKYRHAAGICYTIINPCVYSVCASMNNISSFSDICLYVSIFMLIILLVYSFIFMSSMINARARDIGIFKVLGHSKFTCFGLFSVVPLITFLGVSVIGNICTIIFINLVNEYQAKKLNILFNVFSYSFESMLSYFVISFIFIICMLGPMLIKLKSKTISLLNNIK